MPQLKIKEQGKIKLYEIHEDSLYIGSSQESHLRLRDPDIAGLHCQLKKTRAGWKLVDLESKSGTAVNGEFVNQHALENGDKIKIGSVLMRFEQQEPVAIDPGATRRRLERERGVMDSIPPWGVASIVGGGALLIVVVILMMMKGSGTNEALAKAQQADVYADQGDFDSAREVIADIRRLHNVEPAVASMIERIEKRIEESEASKVVLQDNSALQAEVKRILAFATQNARDIEKKNEVLGKFDAWIAENPDAPKYLIKNLMDNRAIAAKNFENLEKSNKRRNNW